MISLCHAAVHGRGGQLPYQAGSKVRGEDDWYSRGPITRYLLIHGTVQQSTSFPHMRMQVSHFLFVMFGSPSESGKKVRRDEVAHQALLGIAKCSISYDHVYIKVPPPHPQ